MILIVLFISPLSIYLFQQQKIIPQTQKTKAKKKTIYYFKCLQTMLCQTNFEFEIQLLDCWKTKQKKTHFNIQYVFFETSKSTPICQTNENFISHALKFISNVLFLVDLSISVKRFFFFDFLLLCTAHYTISVACVWLNGKFFF